MTTSYNICPENNPLNSTFVDSNSMAFMADQNREKALSHEDQYKCPSCQEIVEEHEFIHELAVCKQCFEDKHGSSFISIDEAQAKRGV